MFGNKPSIVITPSDDEHVVGSVNDPVIDGTGKIITDKGVRELSHPVDELT